MTSGPSCPACHRKNATTANFCRHCGATIVHTAALSDASGAEGAPSSPPLDEQRVFRELCWLCGLPIAVSVVYVASVRLGRASALASLLTLFAMASIATGGALMNWGLVRPALRLPNLRDVFMTALVALVAAPTLAAAFWLLAQLGFPPLTGYLTPYTQDGWPRWVGLADLALVTPLSEELLFRGLIQPKLGQILKSTEAMIVQAALFAALHLSPVILVTHFGMGLALGWVRRRTGSLFPGVALHSAWNAWVVCA